MGAQLSAIAPTATVPTDAYIAELEDVTYAAELGRSRLLKSVRAIHREGEVVVKVFIKPGVPVDVLPVKETLLEWQPKLASLKHAIGYHRLRETDSACYLVRQYIKHNLYDRISTRPFLEPIEKLWLAYQLIRAVTDVHAQGIVHGDLKSENVLITSWKWVYLCDFAAHKPAVVPATDSAQFLFYFDTSQRRTCYLAPERFGKYQPLNSKMDVYSLGCVIAELFLDGAQVFTLAELFRYTRGEYTPPLLSLPDGVREMVQSMISIEPNERKEAAFYLENARGTLFPEVFWTVHEMVEPFAESLGHKPTSDKMVELVWSQYDRILGEFGREVNLVESISTHSFPAIISTPGKVFTTTSRPESELVDTAYLFLPLVCGALRATQSVEWRIRSANMILALSEWLPDSAKLDRCLPYLLVLIKDKVETVQATALVNLTHLLSTVQTLTSMNEKLFAEFLFPHLRHIFTTSPTLKAVYTACLPHIVQAARTLRSKEGEAIDIRIYEHVEEHLRVLLTEKEAVVRRSILEYVPPVCEFLGRTTTNGLILSHAITYMNDKNSDVRADLFGFVAAVGPLIGPTSLEQYVLPLMLQSMADGDEKILAAILKALAALFEIKLIRQKKMWAVLGVCVKFFIYPDVYIRTQAFLLFAAAAKTLNLAQVYSMLKPIVLPVLENPISEYTDHRSYILAAKPPLTTQVFNLAISWAVQCPKSQFWRGSRELAASVAFSAEDRRWLDRLRDVGFNNEDLWKLMLFKEHISHLSLAKRSSPSPLQLQPLSLAELTLEPTAPHLVSDQDEDLKAYAQKKRAELSELSALTEQAYPSGEVVDEVRLGELKLSRTLVTSIKAHRGSITSLVICANHRFFLTGSDDNLLKLWDTRTLEKGSSRSAQTFSLDSSIKSICFLDNTTRFVVSTENGKLTFMEAKTQVKDGIESYVPFEALETHDFGDGFALALHHHGGKLFALMSDCRLCILQLPSLECRTFQNPLDHGPPTCFVFDPSGHWTLIGTRHGVVDLWDLRFYLRIKSWGIGQLRPIEAMVLHPRQGSKWVFVSGGFSKPMVTTWDIQSAECREVFMIKSSGEDLPSLSPVTDLTNRFTSWNPEKAVGERIASLYTQLDIGPKQQYLLSGGSDCVLRFWSLSSVLNCQVISGLEYNAPRVTFTLRLGSVVKATIEKQSTTKKQQPKQSRLDTIHNEESDIGRNHRSTITQIGVLSLNRNMVVSVDEVGCIKLYL